MKLDEKILEEIRREEQAAIEEKAAATEYLIDDVMESDIDDSGDLDPIELDDALKGPLGDVVDETTGVEAIESHDTDESETLDREEIKDAIDKKTRQASLWNNEWSGEE
jgi:hypothetical protein